MKIVLSPGDKLEIGLADTDGAFEVHYDTAEHPKSFLIKETDFLSGNVIGKAGSVLYQEDFKLPASDSKAD